MKISQVYLIFSVFFIIGFGEAYSILDKSRYLFHTFPVSINTHQAVTSITRDRQGKMWITTEDDVMSFDGYSFVSFIRKVDKPENADRMMFNRIIPDYCGNLYLSSRYGGLFRMSADQLCFKNLFKGNVAFPCESSDHKIWLLYNEQPFVFDPATGELMKVSGMEREKGSCLYVFNNEFWVGGIAGGIFRFDTDSQRFVPFSQLFVKDMIQRIVRYGDFVYVLSDHSGLFKYDMSGVLVQHYPLSHDGKTSVYTKDMNIDSQNVMWIGVQNGLFLLDLQSGDDFFLQNDPHQLYSLPYNSVWTIYTNEDGEVWTGTYGGGLAYFNYSDSHYRFFTQTTEIPLSYNIVSCFAEDQDHNIWIGTEGGGLNRLDRESGRITYYKHNSRPDSPGSNLIKKLYYHPIYGKLYAGLYRGGLNEIDPHTGKAFRYRLPDPSKSSRNLDVYDFEVLNDSIVLVIDKERGVFSCNIRLGTTRPLFPDEKLKFYSLYKTRDGLLWLAGQQGIVVINPNNQKIVKRYDKYSEKGRLSGNNVYTICQTVTGDVWIGTRGDGVTVISPRGNVTYYNRKNGLDADIVYSILEDAEFHDLWLTTDKGMFHYVTSSKEFVRFDLPDAFVSGSFYPNAQYKTALGDLLFGHTNGFLWIEPSRIKVNRNKASVYFTGLYINNVKVEPKEKNSPLKQDISVTDKIVLDASDTNIAFSFASSNYLYPSRNQFACRLKGFDDNWRVLAPGEYKAYFSGLSTGRYVFEVKAANNNGIWNDAVTSVVVIKNPPVWFTWYAFVAYFSVLVFLFYWLWRNSSRFRYLLLQLSKEQEQRMRIEQTTEQKVSFFTNISHELRAPLSVVNDLIIRLRPGLRDNKESEELLGQMQSQVIRVNNLLDQLLDIQTIEGNSLIINCFKGDSVTFFRKLCSNYENVATGYNISIIFKSAFASATFLFDPLIWEKIIGNLFINLVRYLPSGNDLTFSLEEPDTRHLEQSGYSTLDSKRKISLRISGNGVLLSLDEANALFYRFYSEAGNTISGINAESRLGLSLVKELLALLQGNIFYTYVERKLEFNIVFPVESAQMSSVNSEDFDLSSYTFSYTAHLLSGLCPQINKEESETIEKKKYSILIVERDAVLRSYLTDILSSKFSVIAAKDGKGALEIALRERISVILTEIMIPIIDGFELCRQLKSNPTTSNIPIIILSSRLSEKDKWKGMDSGADLYIEKPFDSALLIRQIQNLIRTLETQRMISGKTLVPVPTPVSVESADSIFLQRALVLIEKNMDDPSYDVENFVLDMAMSRSLLYKKIKLLTGHSVKTFILEIKLKRAVQLLTDTDLNISEISDRVGFTESRYFGTCFKKRFGMTPSEFIKEKRKADK